MQVVVYQQQQTSHRLHSLSNNLRREQRAVQDCIRLEEEVDDSTQFPIIMDQKTTSPVGGVQPGIILSHVGKRGRVLEPSKGHERDDFSFVCLEVCMMGNADEPGSEAEG